jgi:hypothetical protein
MKTLLRFFTVPLALVIMFVACPLPDARAGGSADSRVGVEKFGDEAIRDLTLKLNDQLDQRHVNVAVIARAGRLRSEMPKGINYTHVAFVVFEPVKTSDGSVSYAYTVYNLYQGADGRDDRSYLKQDLTYDFVAGTAETDIAVCVPSEILQKRLLAVIRSPAYRALHIPEYNLVANPWVDRFDNCVTHSLKICVAAIYHTDDRARIYEDIREYFHPTPIHLRPLQSIGSNFVTGLSRADMDRSGLQTATYDSLKDFLATNGLMQESFVVRM